MAFNNELLPSAIGIVENIYGKQTRGEEVLSIQSHGKYKLVFNDTFQYKYHFERKTFDERDC